MTAAVVADTAADEDAAARAAVIAHLRSCGYRGRGFHGLTADAFREHAEQAYYRAEQACRGALLNPAARAAGVNPRDLFHGPWHTARAHASEELLTWWEHGEPRMTLDAYRTDQLRSGLDEYRAGHDEDEDTMTAVEDAPTRLMAVPTEDRLPRGAQILNEMVDFYRTYFYFPSVFHAYAFALWVMLTHMRDQHQNWVGRFATRLYVRGRTKGVGKTRLGNFIALTGSNAEVAFVPSTTQWGMVRQISEQKKVVFMDNLDQAKGAKRDGAINIIIGGAYPESSTMWSGRQNEEERYIFGPVAVSAIGNRLRNATDWGPAEDRCVVLDVDKKPDHVKLPRFELQDAEIRGRANGIRAAAAQWGSDVAPDVLAYRPDVPDALADRALDVWEPLLAVADMAGGPWPARARTAAAVLALGEPIPADEDDDPFARLTVAERSMVEVSHVLSRLSDDEGGCVTSETLLARMAELPGGARWRIPGTLGAAERQRVGKARTMALARDLGHFGVTRSAIKVPVGGGEYRNGWWASDVLPHRPADLPAYRPSDLSRAAQNDEDEEVAF